MKAIAFTIDAVFAIMIATVGISILLYFHYAPVSPYIIKYSSINVLMKVLSSTTLGNFTATPVATEINSQYLGNQELWPEFLQNNANNASNAYGPDTGSLSFVFNSSTNIAQQSLLAGYGNIYLTSANVIFAISPYTGRIVWTQSAVTTITADILYKGLFIYENGTAVAALDAQNGQKVWDNTGFVAAYGPSTYPFKAYSNMLILPVSSAGNDQNVGIYLNNGTVAWSVNGDGATYSVIMAQGSLVTEIPPNIINQYSYQDQAVPLFIGNIIYPYTSATGLISYQGALLNANATEVTGLASYNGTVYYQGVQSTYAVGGVPNGFWYQDMPSYVGNAIANGQPVASKYNLYSLWANRYLIDQNSQDGVIKWIVHIPYSGTVSPYMMLAYGRLYVAVGSTLLSFGTCQGNSNQSILSNIVSMYISGQYGCEENLLNTANPGQNSSLIVGNSIFPNVVHFNSAHSYIDLGNSSALSPDAGASGRMSLCTWYRINSLANYYGPLIKGVNPPSSGNAWEYTLDQQGGGTGTHPSFTIWNAAGQNIAYGSANSVTFGSMIGNWSFSCFTYDYPGQKASYYFDGIQYNAIVTNTIGPATAGTGDLVVGAGENSINFATSTAYSSVDVADLQIYNIILTQGEIRTLYNQGIGAFPAQSTGLSGWWLFGGDANDYSGNGNTGFPFNVSYANSDYIAPGYLNAYEVDVSRLAVTATNYSTGAQGTYTAGVYNWK